MKTHLIPKQALVQAITVHQIRKSISHIHQRRLMHLRRPRRRGVRGEEHPKAPHKRFTRRRLAAQVRHHPRHDDLLHAPLRQVLLEARAPERAVRGLLHHLVGGHPPDLRHQLGLCRPVENEVAAPPLAEHGVVGGGLVGVAREDYWDGGSSAEGDSGGDGGDYGFGYGGEVILHIDY